MVILALPLRCAPMSSATSRIFLRRHSYVFDCWSALSGAASRSIPLLGICKCSNSRAAEVRPRVFRYQAHYLQRHSLRVWLLVCIVVHSVASNPAPRFWLESSFFLFRNKICTFLTSQRSAYGDSRPSCARPSDSLLVQYRPGGTKTRRQARML